MRSAAALAELIASPLCLQYPFPDSTTYRYLGLALARDITVINTVVTFQFGCIFCIYSVNIYMQQPVYMLIDAEGLI